MYNNMSKCGLYVCLHMSAIHTGDVQIGLMDKKGQLEVEVIRARGLTPKPGSKSLPGNTAKLQLQIQHFWLRPKGQTQTPSFPSSVILSIFPLSFLCGPS